ncbi:MAG TPA: DUF3971 domain-containing protein [Aestuariivirga sp.]|nr:DUF3971 domain-containing protein [Aestuariivirga sp.]
MLVLLSVTAVLVIVGAAFFWRLSQGPVSLDFMTERIEREINKSLSGMTVDVAGAVFEMDSRTNVPHFRLRDLVLLDKSGNLIAKSQRAAISFEGSSLFMGSLVPRGIELIGTRILVKRQLDGGLVLGFGTPAAPENESATLDGAVPDASDPKASREEQTAVLPEATAKSLIDILSGNGGASGTSLEDIRITDASIQLFDEANQANWFAPQADLTFKKMPYGFVVFAKASVASGGTPWRTELSATYRTESRSFAVSARIEDLVPANVSDEIFALAQFAKVDVPLSGHAEIEISDAGVIASASAEFAAAAGVVGLPGYIAQPIVIDEGALRVDYDAPTGGFKIVDSIILVGGSRAELTGRLDPVRASDGRLTDLKIDLKATNVSVDTQGTVKNPVLVDRIEFLGNASAEGAVMDIEDLVVMSGNTGVRLRGTITGGDESAGIRLSGRVRDLSADFVKKLWPPIVVPKSRKWVTDNVQSGRITEGTFNVDIPVNGLAEALRQKVLPNETIDFQFSMTDVTSSYFKSLPPLLGASGHARLRGDSFELTIESGKVVLPSNGTVQVSETTFKAEKLLTSAVRAVFALNLSASAPDLLELAALPDLNLLRNANFVPPNIGGQAEARVDFSMPLIKDLSRDQIQTAAKIQVTDASIKQVIPNVDLSEGSLLVAFDRTGITASGPVKINGFPSSISWARPAGPESRATASIDTELDDKAREKLGIKLGDYLQGPVKVQADIEGVGEKNASIKVKANLAKAEMFINAISWRRPPTANTTASFTYLAGDAAGRKVENLVVKGQSLSLKGDVFLTADGGLKSAKFSQVWLSDENNFTLTMVPAGEGQAIDISGKSFDARPFIKSIFAKDAGSAGRSASRQNLSVNAAFDRVIANRGEVVTGVSAIIGVRNSLVANADVEGKFLSERPLAIRVRPNATGRQLQITSADGGAALRASNLYSKVAGGSLEFSAFLANGSNSTIQNGNLVLRDFDVRNEAALGDIDSRGKSKKSGPRREALSFTKLTLPFTTDAKFIRIGDSLLKGNELGATAEGLIRKSDGAIDITGTIIPAYGINAAVGNIPLFGEILTGGKGQGIFGLTFAFGGTMASPKIQFNPLSAIAPGILRKMFEYDGSGPPAKQKVKETN